MPQFVGFLQSTKIVNELWRLKQLLHHLLSGPEMTVTDLGMMYNFCSGHIFAEYKIAISRRCDNFLYLHFHDDN